jgi:hypothetical protein
MAVLICARATSRTEFEWEPFMAAAALGCSSCGARSSALSGIYRFLSQGANGKRAAPTFSA